MIRMTAGQAEHIGETRRHTKFCSENLKGGDHAEDLGVDVIIILEWILGKQGGQMWNGCIRVRRGTSGGLLEIRYSRSGFMNGEKFRE